MIRERADRLLHVRFEGRSLDVALADLKLAVEASDHEVKTALARYLDVSVQRFHDFTIDRHATGNVTLRPEAVFG